MAYTTADAQFLRDKDNKLILKEFAVYYPDFSESYLSVATFAPPYEKQCLPKHVRRHNSYVTHNIHGLEWNDGEYGFHHITNILWSMTRQFNILYVKGTEKVKVLQTWMPHLQVLNIEDLGCPNLTKLPLFDSPCENEIHTRFPRFNCASKNAQRFWLWLCFHTAAANI